jgi:hypothetical protein
MATVSNQVSRAMFSTGLSVQDSSGHWNMALSAEMPEVALWGGGVEAVCPGAGAEAIEYLHHPGATPDRTRPHGVGSISSMSTRTSRSSD